MTSTCCNRVSNSETQRREKFGRNRSRKARLPPVNRLRGKTPVVHFHLEFATDEFLDQSYGRTLSYIIRVRLKLNPTDRSSFAKRARAFSRTGPGEADCFAGRLRSRQCHLHSPGGGAQCLQVLRQTGATEGKPRLQIGRRYVEFGVLHEKLQKYVAVDPVRLGENSYLIRKSHLEPMKGIRGIFQQTGRSKVPSAQPALKMTCKPGRHTPPPAGVHCRPRRRAGRRNP